MPFFLKREKAVRKLIDEYFVVAERVFDHFHESMKKYLKAGRCEDLIYEYKRIDAAESRADDLRVEIEKTLYRRALLPESRGDILGLLEHFDKMPNLAEAITTMVVTQCIEVPEVYRERLLGMLELNVETFRLVHQGVDTFFTQPDEVDDKVAPVDKLESASDAIEQDLISELFRSDMDRAEVLILRDLIQLLGDISDNAERVAHRLTILSFKRRI